MQKSVRIQPIEQQDTARRQELAASTPEQRMKMLFSLIDQSAKETRLQRVARIRHVSVR